MHAERALDGRDRAQLERLCRYLARPPLSHDRLSLLPDGQVQVALKSTWSDGAQAVVLSPLDLLSQLCALVPAPRLHLFDEDLTVCPRCEHSPMRITQVALTAQAIEQALVRHGLCARPPPAIARVEALGQLALAFGP